jgi:hypothetical protein
MPNIRRLAAIALALSAPAAVSYGAASTPAGQISVNQVVQMLERSPSDPIASQVALAYLAGVGEAAGVIVDIGGVRCNSPLGLDRDSVLAAIAGADGAARATPLIVTDMLKRAGCRR